MLKFIISLLLVLILTLTSFVSIFQEIRPVYAADSVENSQKSSLELAEANSSVEWSVVDQSLIEAVRGVHNITTEFANIEFDNWIDSLMEKVDEKFLSWYFSYTNQKLMEFGTPFTWLLYAGNRSFNFLRPEDQKIPEPNQLLKQRMIQDFEDKFNELVLDPKEAQIALGRLTNRIVQSYASAIGTKFALVKNSYKIPDRDWERYINDLATITYSTGTSRSSLASESIADGLINDLLVVTTAAVGSKVALNVASKAAAKIAGKFAGAVAAKIGAQILDPVLGIGILIWDIWDYNHMVEKSRPVLRKNILDYLNEVKMSILYSPENSILAAIEKLEGNLITALETQRLSS